MSRLAAIIDEIRLRGFNVRLIDGRIKIQGPTAPDTETEKMLDELRLHKEEIKSILAEDDPLLPVEAWYPEFHRLHVQVIQETPNLDWQSIRGKRPDLYRAIKDREHEIDELGDARLSVVIAIMAEWRGLILRAESEDRGIHEQDHKKTKV